MKRPRRSLPRRSGAGILTATSYPLPRLRAKRLQPERPELVLMGSQPAPRWSTIRRDEVRYLYDSVEELQQALEERGLKATSYHTRTVYLKPKRGYQRRLRRYEGEGPWYLEKKQRSGTMVTKSRRKFFGTIPKGRLTSGYRRTAYEWGRWRLTIDSQLRFRHRGQTIQLPGFVVELKGRATGLKGVAPPTWLGPLLRGHEAPGFGKRNWAELVLGLRG